MLPAVLIVGELNLGVKKMMNLEREQKDVEAKTAEVGEWVAGMGQAYLELAPTLVAKAMVRHKIEHTGQVAGLMPLIWGGSTRECSLAEAMIAGLTHDVGRYVQIALGGRISDQETGLDHAEISAEMLGDSGLVMPSRQGVIEAVRAHSRWGEISSPVSGVLRDGDKVANLGQIENWYKGLRNEGPSPLSGVVVEQLARGEVVRAEDVVTKSDRVAVAISWLFGLHHLATANILLEHKVPDRMLVVLARSLNGGAKTDRGFRTAVSMVEGWKDDPERYLLSHKL